MARFVRFAATASLVFALLGVCPRAVPAVASAAGEVRKTTRYTVAVIPSAPPEDISAAWLPFLERLSRATGWEFDLKAYDKMSEFERDIERGAADFLFASPTQITVALAVQGYVPLVRGSARIAGVLFVRADSPIRSIRDLDNKEIAFVGTKNVCSVFTRSALKGHVHLTYKSLFAGSSSNVLKMVQLGKADAGATLDVELERIKDASFFRPILKTDKMAPHPLAAHPRVPKQAQDAVRQAILGWSDDPAAQQQLKAIRMAKPVSADYDRDYRELETMDVRSLSQWGE